VYLRAYLLGIDIDIAHIDIVKYCQYHIISEKVILKHLL